MADGLRENKLMTIDKKKYYDPNIDRKSKILFQKSKKNDEYLLRGRQKA